MMSQAIFIFASSTPPPIAFASRTRRHANTEHRHTAHAKFNTWKTFCVVHLGNAEYAYKVEMGVRGVKVSFGAEHFHELVARVSLSFCRAGI